MTPESEPDRSFLETLWRGDARAGDLCADFRVPALLGELERRFSGGVGAPVTGDDAQSREHFRGGRPQLRPARPVSFSQHETKEPRQRVGVMLLRDDADTHSAKLRIQLSAIDSLPDQRDTGRRTPF